MLTQEIRILCNIFNVSVLLSGQILVHIEFKDERGVVHLYTPLTGNIHVLSEMLYKSLINQRCIFIPVHIYYELT